MSLYEFKLSTARQGLYEITGSVRDAIARSGAEEGVAVVFCPHTTGAITINENADSDVVHDLLLGLDAAFPDRGGYLHSEGNSAAHLKSSCVGASETIVITGGKPLLGTWQGVYFCEFDGPRQRKYFVKVH